MQLDGRQTLVIVEDSQGLDAAERQIAVEDGPRAGFRWATHSPYLIDLLRHRGIEPLILDGDVSQDEADAVGYAALDASRTIANHLDGLKFDWPLGIRAGWPMRHVLHRALTSYLYKAFLLARLIDHAGPDARIMAVGNPEATPVSDYNVMPNRFDTLFAVLAARMGLELIEHRSTPPSGAMETGDFLRPTLWSRVTTVLNAPIASTAYRLWSQALGGRAVALSRKRAKLAIAVMASNDLIEDTAMSLFFRGVMLFQAPNPPVRLGPIDISANESELATALKALVLKHAAALPANSTGPFEAAADAMASRIVAALRHGAAVAQALPGYVDRLRAIGGARPLVLLANGMAGGAANLLRDALRTSNIPVVVAEHGVAPGLSTLHHAQLQRERAQDSEGTIFWTPVQLDHAVEVAGLDPTKAVVSGIPTRLQRIGGYALQRRVVRRNLGINRRLLAWCTGLYPNNMQFLPHYWRDSEYHRIRREVLHSVLGTLGSDVLLKLYPTYRYTDPDPLSDPARAPSNVRIEQFVDFRSLRAAADAIMVDGPGSVLGWVWGSQQPVIFLETGMYTLRDSVRAQFEDAVFYIDVRHANWQAELRELLSLPDRELRRLYGLKAERRREVGEHCIVGPSGSPARRAADYIVGQVSGWGPAAAPRPGENTRSSHSYGAIKL